MFSLGMSFQDYAASQRVRCSCGKHEHPLIEKHGLKCALRPLLGRWREVARARYAQIRHLLSPPQPLE